MDVDNFQSLSMAEKLRLWKLKAGKAIAGSSKAPIQLHAHHLSTGRGLVLNETSKSLASSNTIDSMVSATVVKEETESLDSPEAMSPESAETTTSLPIHAKRRDTMTISADLLVDDTSTVRTDRRKSHICMTRGREGGKLVSFCLSLYTHHLI